MVAAILDGYKVSLSLIKSVPAMLSLKSFLRPGRLRQDILPIAEAMKPSLPPGYFRPMTVSELLATTRRQQWLQSLWDYSSLPKDMYRQYYLVPLEHCVTLMQQFPLTVNVCLLKLTPNCSKQISAGFIKADRQTFLTW